VTVSTAGCTRFGRGGCNLWNSGADGGGLGPRGARNGAKPSSRTTGTGAGLGDRLAQSVAMAIDDTRMVSPRTVAVRMVSVGDASSASGLDGEGGIAGGVGVAGGGVIGSGPTGGLDGGGAVGGAQGLGLGGGGLGLGGGGLGLGLGPELGGGGAGGDDGCVVSTTSVLATTAGGARARGGGGLGLGGGGLGLGLGGGGLGLVVCAAISAGNHASSCDRNARMAAASLATSLCRTGGASYLFYAIGETNTDASPYERATMCRHDHDPCLQCGDARRD